MNANRLLFTALIASAPAAALAFTRVGVGLNFGFPVYDYPAPSRVVVVQQPAAAEELPPSPGPEYVWIAGRWEWDTAGNRWVWYSGSWQKPPTPTAMWQAGYWSQKGPAWSWVGSHWSIPNPAATTPPPPAVPSGPPAAPQSAPAAATAPGAAPSQVVVNEAPPPPIVEQIYTSPGPDYVWIPGYWNWNGAWVWVSGRYALPPYRGAVWVGGAWSARGGRWAWSGGHWR